MSSNGDRIEERKDRFVENILNSLEMFSFLINIGLKKIFHW